MITKSTYIHSAKGLRSAINYILNEEKTTIPGICASTVLSYKCRHRKEKTVLDFLFLLLKASKTVQPIKSNVHIWELKSEKTIKENDIKTE